MSEFRPGSFQMIPPVIKNLVIINGLVWLAEITLGSNISDWMFNMFALHDVHSQYFKLHQLVTYMFMHDNHGIQHILYNMFALWMFGSVLENYWGAKRFLTFYMISGIGAAICHLAVLYHEMAPIAEQISMASPEQQQEFMYSLQNPLNEATVGASGAIFGCLAAFGYLFPNQYIYLYFLVPIKVKWAVLGYAAFELFYGINPTA